MCLADVQRARCEPGEMQSKEERMQDQLKNLGSSKTPNLIFLHKRENALPVTKSWFDNSERW